MNNLPSDPTALAICIASHNTLSTRKTGLDRCIESLNIAVKKIHSEYPDLTVIVSWVDDASTDSTWEYVQRKLQVPFTGTKLRTCSHQSYARNLAAKLTDSEYLCFCDSDDHFFPEHLVESYHHIQQSTSEGLKYAVGLTQVFIDPSLGIHPEWLPRISHTIPITKIIHRTAWEFVEGFPVHDLYKKTSTEDQDFMTLLGSVFQIQKIPLQTVEYCCYPDSYFEKQLDKFRKHPSEAQPTAFELKHLELHRANQAFLNAKLELLKCKLLHAGWHDRLSQFAVTYKLNT